MELFIGNAVLVSVPRLSYNTAAKATSAGGIWPPSPFSRENFGATFPYCKPFTAEFNVTIARFPAQIIRNVLYSTHPCLPVRVSGLPRVNGSSSLIEESGLEHKFTASEGRFGGGNDFEVDCRGAVWGKAGDVVEYDREFGTRGIFEDRFQNINVQFTPNSFAVDSFESRVYECDLTGEGCPVGNNEVGETSDRTSNVGTPSAWERERRIVTAWEHWRKIGSPKLHLAPMVDQSELPFRMLCRKYGAKAAYTPMLHSRVFLEDRNYRVDEFSTCEEDRPLFVQFSANDPEILLQAAQQVQSQCDYVDINLGCPQRVARKGNYGAFLMDNLPLVRSLVSHLACNLSVPVSCKIRIFPELEHTVAYARMLEAAGCSLLAVHGRTREQKFNELVRADWNAIRAVKEAVRIPVLANGNIRWMEDVEACLAATGVDGVMSAESLLENPAVFAGYRTVMDQDPMNPLLKIIDERVLCLEYIDLVEKYPVPMRMVLRHIFKLLTNYWFQHHTDLRDELHSRQYKFSLEYVRDLMRRLIARGPPLFSRYNGQEFPGARPPPAELPIVEREPPPLAAPYIPNTVEQNRLMRMIRRRPGKKISLPDWSSGQTNEFTKANAFVNG